MTGLRGRWRAVTVLIAVTACWGTSTAVAGGLPAARSRATTTAAITKDPAYRVVFDLDEAAPAGSRGVYAIRTDLAGRKPIAGESTTSAQRAPDLSSRGDQIAAVFSRRGVTGACPRTDRVQVRALTSWGFQRFLDVPGYACGETVERVLWFQPMRVLALVRTTSGGTRVAELDVRDPGSSGTVWESPRAYTLEAVHGLRALYRDVTSGSLVVRSLAVAAPGRTVAGSIGVTSAAWAPGGASFAVTSVSGTGTAQRGLLQILPAAGGARRMLIRAAGTTFERPAWSPDGRWIYLVRRVGSARADLVRIRPSGGTLQQVTATPTADEGTPTVGFVDSRPPSSPVLAGIEQIGARRAEIALTWPRDGDTLRVDVRYAPTATSRRSTGVMSWSGAPGETETLAIGVDRGADVFRWRAVDFSGNASAWSPPITVHWH